MPAITIIREYKTRPCRKCGATFSTRRCPACAKKYNADWDKKNADRKRKTNKKWVEENRGKSRAAQARYRARHPEKIKVYAEKVKAEHPERIYEWQSRYRDKHKDLMRKRRAIKYHQNQDMERVRVSEWRRANPEYVRVYARIRRARKLNAGGMLSKGIEERLRKLQKGKYACCHGDLTKLKNHLDHIIPLALGGANVDSNVQLLCATCNLQKGAKHPVDFMQSRGFLL